MRCGSHEKNVRGFLPHIETPVVGRSVMKCKPPSDYWPFLNNRAGHNTPKLDLLYIFQLYFGCCEDNGTLTHHREYSLPNLFHSVRFWTNSADTYEVASANSFRRFIRLGFAVGPAQWIARICGHLFIGSGRMRRQRCSRLWSAPSTHPRNEQMNTPCPLGSIEWPQSSPTSFERGYFGCLGQSTPPRPCYTSVPSSNIAR